MVARMGNLSALRDFIAFVATVRGDISHITAPPFILAPQSLTEFPSYWAEHPALFAAPGLESCPRRRMLAVLKLYVASLQRQYYVGRAVKDGLKKPLNPFLGEVFFSEWVDPQGKGRVKLISEQVSHHPPTTACYLSDDEHGVRAEAYSTQVTTLSGTSILIKQSGHALLTVDEYNDTFLLPLPDVWARSVLSGVPYPELNGTYRIVSSAGYTAEMRFSGRWLWQGERNGFEATIYRTNDPSKKPYYTVTGSWSDVFTIREGDANGKILETYSVADSQNAPMPARVTPIEKQNPWESRRAWAGVIDAIRKGDVSSIISEKSKVETAQREMRKKEKAEGRKWETAFFTRCDANSGGSSSSTSSSSSNIEERFFQLVRTLAKDDKAEAQRLLGSNGCWRFDREKAKRWQSAKAKPSTPLG